MRNRLFVTALLSASFVAALAQVQERGGRNMSPGEGVMGKVTAVSKDSLTISPVTGGDAVTVKISDSTRVMKDRQAGKLEDIKTDDTIFVRGKLNGNVMDAAMVGVLNPQMVERMQQGGGMMGGFNPADMGKKFIAGRVTAINETKLTIARPDGQSQDIEVDENTSFKKGAESITLPDIKVGDFVRGRGELKDSVFVPQELIVGRPQMRVMMGGPGGPAEAVKKREDPAPAASAPTTPAGAPAAPPK